MKRRWLWKRVCAQCNGDLLPEGEYCAWPGWTRPGVLPQQPQRLLLLWKMYALLWGQPSTSLISTRSNSPGQSATCTPAFLPYNGQNKAITRKKATSRFDGNTPKDLLDNEKGCSIISQNSIYNTCSQKFKNIFKTCNYNSRASRILNFPWEK